MQVEAFIARDICDQVKDGEDGKDNKDKMPTSGTTGRQGKDRERGRQEGGWASADTARVKLLPNVKLPGTYQPPTYLRYLPL
jgi:hypothetical protein